MWLSKNKNFYDYRKSYHASISGRISNLSTLSKSRLPRKDELELINKIIQDLKELSKTLKKNNQAIFNKNNDELDKCK